MIPKELINKRFEGDLQIIVDEILAKLPKAPKAIVLYGGYGRGEGAWFIDESGNVSPYNDYDIDIISNERINPSIIYSLRENLAKKLNIKWIDLGVISTLKLRFFKPTIQNVDFKEASRLIYGDSSIYSYIPSLDHAEIGDFDIIKLFQTRIWTFLGSWVGNFHNLNPEESRFFQNQMAKAMLAACDLILIKNKSYVTSYKERVNKACQLMNDEEFTKYAQWALNEKLTPSSILIYESDMKLLYNKIYEIFKYSMKYANHNLWLKFQNPDDTKHFLYYCKLQFIRNFAHKLLGHGGVIEKSIDIFCAQNYVFQAWGDTINTEYLVKASNILIKWGYIKTIETDWFKLREIVSYARNYQ